MLQGSQHWFKMQVVFPFASYFRACHSRLTYLRALHNWSLSLWLSWCFAADWHIMAKINTLARSLIGSYKEISHYFPTLISSKESIKLTKYTMGKSEHRYMFSMAGYCSSLFHTYTYWFQDEIIKIKVLLNGTDTACPLQTYIFQGSEKGHYIYIYL